MIRKATKKDLYEIEYWLEQDHNEDGGSLRLNIDWIRQAQQEQRLYALVFKKAVAFIVGTDSSLDFLAVKKDQRKKGYGRMLAEYHLERLWKKGLRGLSIHCKPVESVSFWSKMGFITDPTHISDAHDCYMYITHPRQRDASDLDKVKTVEIKLLDYITSKTIVEPVCMLAEETKHEILILNEYVQLLPNILLNDLILSISVNGKQIHLDWVYDSCDAGVQIKPPFLSLWNFDLTKAVINSKILM